MFPRRELKGSSSSNDSTMDMACVRKQSFLPAYGSSLGVSEPGTGLQEPRERRPAEDIDDVS
jgi:hypothetical protein